MAKKVRVVLGSGSPRRQDILKSLGVNFSIDVPSIDESSKEVIPKLFCEDITNKKFEHVRSKYMNEDCLIITGDTVVCFKGNVFGKPKNRQDAFNTIKKLSHETHQVITSITIGFSRCGLKITESETTDVSFFDLDAASINHYLDFNTYSDKAGSYAIQDPNCYFVSEIRGSLSNVIGLPIELLVVSLKNIFKQKFGSNDWKNFI